MGTRNDDISLKIAKAVVSGFLPDVNDNEIDYLSRVATSLFGLDGGLRAILSPSPQMATFIRAVEAKQSAAMSFFGDSTGDSDGSVATEDKLPARAARKIAEKYSSTHHTLFKSMDNAAVKWKPWQTLNNHPLGRRHVITTTQGLRWVPPVHADAANNTNIYALGGLIDPETWTPVATQCIITRGRKEVATVMSNELVAGLRLKPTGSLGFMRSVNGTSWATEQVSTVPVPGVVGTPLWVCGVCTIDPGVSGDIKFYTSTNGVDWTQLGTTITISTPWAAIWTPVEGSFFEIAGENWPSTASVFKGKIYEVFFRDGFEGKSVVPNNIESWERTANSATTYGGAPTIYFLNASWSGSAIADHNVEPRLGKETVNYGQTAVVINDGHNESTKSGQTNWITPYSSWVTNIKARLPKALVNVVGQNPHTSVWPNEAAYGQEHITRIFELSDAAVKNGWGFINVYQAYLNDSRGVVNLIKADDGLHPNQDGYYLSGDTVALSAGVPI